MENSFMENFKNDPELRLTDVFFIFLLLVVAKYAFLFGREVASIF